MCICCHFAGAKPQCAPVNMDRLFDSFVPKTAYKFAPQIKGKWMSVKQYPQMEHHRAVFCMSYSKMTPAVNSVIVRPLSSDETEHGPVVNRSVNVCDGVFCCSTQQKPRT